MMNHQANSTLNDSLFDCFENQDWSSGVIEILEISLTKHHYCCQREDTNTYRGEEDEEEEGEELEDIFEDFLFRVDEQIEPTT